MCYCPTPTLHLNLALTGDSAFQLSLKKTHSVWFISVLNYGDTENVLINHLLLVIPMLYPCHYTNLWPHKPHKHAPPPPPPPHTHTHTHTHCPNWFFSHTVQSDFFLLTWGACFDVPPRVHFCSDSLKDNLEPKTHAFTYAHTVCIHTQGTLCPWGIWWRDEKDESY